MTKDYVPSHVMVKRLRRLFAEHEKAIREFAGLPPLGKTDDDAELSATQQATLGAALKMMEDNKMSPDLLRRALGEA